MYNKLIKLLANPQELAKIAADGLKKLWCVNIQECPYDITLEHKLKLAEKNVNEGRINIWKFVCLNMSIMSRYNCFYNT